MTMVFESVMTLTLRGMTIDEVLAAYRIWEEQLWPLVLLALQIGPPLFARLRAR
jgi:hypothetical protein